MIRFKTFLTEDVDSKEFGQPVEHLPLYLGHGGIAMSDFMLRDIHSKLLGKAGKTRAESSFPAGIPVMFGVDPKSGEHFISHGSNIIKNFNDVNKFYGHDPKMLPKMMEIAKQLPTITPRKGGVYSAKVLYTNPNEIPNYIPPDNSSFGVVVNTDHRGKQLSNKDRKSFNFNPEVYNVDPTMKADPLRYSMGQQIQFLTHMDAAKKEYSKMAPEALDDEEGVVNTHRDSVIQYTDALQYMQGEPNFDDYVDFVAQKQAGKLDKAKTVPAKDRILQRHSDIVNDALNNKKYVTSIINVTHHLNSARAVLGGVVSSNENPGNVVISHGEDKSILRLK